jgi:hypothetical protein
MEKMRDNTHFMLDGKAYPPVLGRDFFWQIEDVTSYLIRHGNNFNIEGIQVAVLGENRRRKTPLNSALSVISPPLPDPVKRSKEYLKLEYTAKLKESKEAQLKLWANTGYDFSKECDLFIGMKVKVFLKDRNHCTFKTCTCCKYKSPSKKDDGDNNDDNDDNDDDDYNTIAMSNNHNSPSNGHSNGRRNSHSNSRKSSSSSGSGSGGEQEEPVCAHAVLGVVTCVLPEAFEFESLWGIVYDPASLLSFFDFNYHLPSSSSSSSSSASAYSSSRNKEHFSVYGDVFSNKGTNSSEKHTVSTSTRRSRSGSVSVSVSGSGTYTGYDGNEGDRRTAILTGYESLSLVDLQKALTNYHKKKVCSDLPDLGDTVWLDGTHTDYPVKSVKGSTPMKRNATEELKEKIEKEADKEKVREKEKEKEREKEMEKEKEREKKRVIDEEAAVNKRVSAELEVATKKLQKKRDSEVKKLNETIEALTLAATQAKATEVENEKKRLVLVKSIAALKKEKEKEKETSIEKKSKDNKWSIEISVLKRNLSELKQETAAKLLSKDAQLLLLKKSNLEEKDDLRLELGAGKRKEIKELTQIIEALREGQNISSELDRSRKRRREEEVDVEDDSGNPRKIFKNAQTRVTHSSTHSLFGDLTAHTADSGTVSSLLPSADGLTEDEDADAAVQDLKKMLSQGNYISLYFYSLFVSLLPCSSTRSHAIRTHTLTLKHPHSYSHSNTHTHTLSRC